MTKQSIGTQFLNDYAQGLLQGNSEKMASLFHPGLSYIVNNEVRPGAESLSNPETWDFIFSKIEFQKAEASHVIEVHPGHVFYHEFLQVRSKTTGEFREGHFGDEAVINTDGKMLLVNRIADTAYFAWFETALQD